MSQVSDSVTGCDALVTHREIVHHHTMYDEIGCHRTLSRGASLKFDMPKFKHLKRKAGNTT